jgi:branched-chain amino acid transport system permease protein
VAAQARGDAAAQRAGRRIWSALRDGDYRNELIAVVVMLGLIQLLPRRPVLGLYVLGITSASSLLLHAVAVILVFRANRFINFAQLQVATTAGGLFLALVQGQLLLDGVRSVCGCVSREPGPLARNINFVIVFFVVLGLSALVSWAASLTLLRRFQRSPRIMLTLVTLFAGQALAGANDHLQGLFLPPRSDTAAYGRVLARSTRPPGDFDWHIGPLATLHQSEVLLVIAAVAAVLGLTRYLRRSQTGVAIRAAAEGPARAETLGVDVHRVTARVWFIAGLLAGLAGILASFGGNIPPQTQTLAIPAQQLGLILAVAVMARFQSLTMAAVGALTLGLLQTAAQFAYGSPRPFDAAFMFLVGGLLLLQRSRQSHRERDDPTGSEVTREVRPVPRELRSLPQVKSWTRIGAVTVAGVGLGLPWALSSTTTTQATTYAIYAIVGLSLLILTGWAGQISLGQFGFAAIGAWAAASSHLPFPLALAAAGTVGAATSIIVGVPALKLRGLNLAISTLAFAVTARALFLDKLYLGRFLPTAVERPSLLGMDLDDTRVFYYFCLFVLTGCCLAVMGLRRSRLGRVLIGTRANEAAAQSFGISVLRARLTAFAVAGFLAALAGALVAYQLRAVPPETFGPDMSVKMFMYSVIGGLGGIVGPLLGFTFMGLLNIFALNPLLVYTASGSGALLLLIASPGGLAQVLYDTRDAALRRLAVRLRIPVPSLMGERRAGEAMARAHLDEQRGKPKEGAALLYKLDRQWALDRYGTTDGSGERVGQKEPANG